jgi:hypothetical protein
MPRSPQDLLKFADQFEKIAVDIPQPEGFDEEFEKYLALLSRNKGPATLREMPVAKELEWTEPSEGSIVVDDLPFSPEEAEKLSIDDENDMKLGVSGHPWDVDEEDVKKEQEKSKCAACSGVGYKDGEFCKKCQGSGRGKEKKEKKEEKPKSKAASLEMILVAKKKEKKHLDPKAKVRNRGTVCVPAESAKDHKDHFPINDEDQARNALARVHQYSSAPPWYKGSLKGLQDLVSRKVHSKYPGIGKSEKKKKKSAMEHLIEKYGEKTPLVKRAASLTEWAHFISSYGDSKADMLNDISEAIKMLAFKDFPPDQDDPEVDKVRDLMLKQAELFGKIYPEISALDQQLYALAAPVHGIEKRAGNVAAVTNLLNNYESTAALLRDVAKAQFGLIGVDPNDPNVEKDDMYESSQKIHDMIMAFADQLEAEESKYW